MMLSQVWTGLLTAAVLAGTAIACASAPPAAPEPTRRPEVIGLAPIPGIEGDAQNVRPTQDSPSRPAATSRQAPQNTPPSRSDVGCSGVVGPGTLRRSALSRTLDAGLGTWLRGVDVEAKIDRGRFRGWLVRGIYTGDPCWANVDLRAGDVVNRINHHPIEHPEEAQEVWNALRNAGEIVVEFLRGGQPKTLKFAVVDDTE
jgi:hypothetical protein